MDEETKEQHACSNASASNSLPLFTMKRQRGKYWQFIKLVAPSHEIREWESKDAVSAWCELCRVKLSYSKGNINSVKSHLRAKHANHLAASSENETSAKKRKVSTITDAFSSMQNAPMKPASKGDSKKAEAILVNWIATLLQPFLLVRDSGFVALWRFLNALRTQVDPPSRNKVKGQVVKASEYVMMRVTKKMESEMDYFAMTTDIWSSRTMKSYMAITIHYLTAEFVMRGFTLDVTPLQGAHTGDYICKFWNESFTHYGLDKKNYR